jgi:4-alpha-glucanotransferase
LPGPYGIGDLGPAAHAWLDTLAAARQKWWQMLPLGPTGYGDSPYQSFSAFAGNPYLISPDLLLREGLIRQEDLAGVNFSHDRVDYGNVISFKIHLLEKAWASFQNGAASHLRGPFDEFRHQQPWLDDYALYMALREAHHGSSWQQWPRDLVLRRPEALNQARQQLAHSIGRIQFTQLLFFRQWNDLRQHAHSRNIRFIGDIPIFVSIDSADVWANPDLFLLDEHRHPTVVAGVPPDYFSKTGQLWGNPLYHWEALKQSGYRWWIDRVRGTLAMVDLIRLDHFRGFEAAWHVPAGDSTAERGEWVKGPGIDLFVTMRETLGGLPLIAEDLGVITPEVEVMRDELHLPGMRILQFAFGGATEDRFLPHNYEHNAVVYTGTHDNDTTRGWFRTLTEAENKFLRRYMPYLRDDDVSWDLMRLAWASVADLTLAPLQDVLSLGHEARMNFPGQPSGNWGWRFKQDMLTSAVIDRLADMTEVYSR